MRILIFVASCLVLPLTGLLFLQWPLRDWLHAYSREANDLGQIVFALYVAVAIYAASSAGKHLAVHHQPRVAAQPQPMKTWRRWAAVLCLGPWSVFMVWASAGSIVDAVAKQERFAETFNPGYFVIKLALGLLFLLVIVDLLQTTKAAKREVE
jgi:sterol desaturase/sphingolipid hydroxylase (fatty acid hydroxylase superfamily)